MLRGTLSIRTRGCRGLPGGTCGADAFENLFDDFGGEGLHFGGEGLRNLSFACTSVRVFYVFIYGTADLARVAAHHFPLARVAAHISWHRLGTPLFGTGLWHHFSHWHRWHHLSWDPFGTASLGTTSLGTTLAPPLLAPPRHQPFFGTGLWLWSGSVSKDAGRLRDSQ
jgi:hypothetical protein